MKVLTVTLLLLLAAVAANSQYGPPIRQPQRTRLNSRPRQEEAPPCGIRKVQQRPLIVGGKETVPGEWPWHAAVYHLRDGGRTKEYKCGGTLISNEYVLTTASCARYGINKTEVAILVELGQYSLVESSPHTVSVPVSRVHVHGEYKSSEKKYDIGLLRLKTAVNYTDYIQPACLPVPGQKIELYDEALGTIVGWGFEKARKLSDNLRSARVPVIPYIECLQSDVDFFSQEIYSGMYCAGYQNGTAPCFGDAGGGMFFQNPRNRAWTLRGIISFTHLIYTVTGGCNTEHFFGLTNVVDFLPWINETMTNGDRVDPTVVVKN